LLAAVSFVVMFHPDMQTSAWVAVAVLIAVVVGIHRHNYIAPPKAYAIAATKAEAEPGSDLAPVLAEAKREIG
jgi:hypothetical protein